MNRRGKSGRGRADARFGPRARGTGGIAYACLGAALAASACGGRAVVPSGFSELEQIRKSPVVQHAQEGAPQAFALAEQQRTAAMKAEAEGDGVGAAILTERAVAGYQHALVLARLAEAGRLRDGGAAARVQEEARLRELSAARARTEREADELEKRLAIARETLVPVASGPAAPAREAARLVAARALATQARLLCGSARLLAPTLDGLDAAESELTKLEGELDANKKPAPIDAAARARAACLGVLTKSRRAAGDQVTGQADALLAELSATSWAPARDERGVVVTLRQVFRGGALAPDAKAKLTELGRVAAAHPTSAVQVVFHSDKSMGSPEGAKAREQERAANQSLGELVEAALASGGAAKERLGVETAGNRAPIVDPDDAAHRARNERVEVVFVTAGQ